MQTSSIVTTLIVIVIALGAAYYFFMMPQGAMAPTTDTTTDTSLAGSDNIPNDTPSSSAFGVGTTATLGSYLTASSNNMTLYIYTPDTPGVSNCSGQCAVNWPPYTVAAGSNLGVSTGMTGTYGTITRTDGTTQVTYNGAPLYFYIKDTKAGDVTGQGVGGVWYVLKP